MKFEKHTTNHYSVKLPNGDVLTVNQSGYDAINALMAEANAEIESLRTKICSLTRELNAAKQPKQVYNDLEPMTRYFRED